ncbi:MAG TPA: ATP-binding protein [Terriglobales bacterium]|nr:ATP-binding protein [Terriglobales bacterium]
MLGALGLIALIAAAIRGTGGDHVSSLHHLYLIPALWAALTRGVPGGALAGLVAGLVQALSVLPLIERAGVSWLALDGLVSLSTPLTMGLTVGRLVDQSRGRGAQLGALLEIQRSLALTRPLGERLAVVAVLTRHALGVDRVRLVVEAGGDTPVAASAPGTFEPAELPSNTGPTPCRRLVLPLDAGQGPAGALIVERDGDLSTAVCGVASALAVYVALAIENARLTERQRHFAQELDEKIAGATRRLRELDQAKNEFLTIASHELRTPLTALQGFSELLLTREVPAERARRYLGHVHTESQRLGRIVGDLLDLSRIESGRGPELRPVALDLREIIEANIEIFASQHPRHHFDWRGAGPVPPLCADRDAVDRMLKNLLSNAIKYSPHGGRVRVEAGVAVDQPGMIALSVEDDGVGIAADALPRIFDPYVRIANPETAAAPGLGLGLSLVRGLAHAHGGSIEVESLPGKGSRFRVLLPA